MEDVEMLGEISSTTNTDLRRLLMLSILTGSTMLKYGAETYRVEDTIKRICYSRLGVKFVYAFVIPSAIFVSIDHEGELISYLKRVSSEGTDLNKIHLVNEFSRKFVSSEMTVMEGLDSLKDIDAVTIYSNKEKLFLSGIVASTFSGMFGADVVDMALSFLVGIITMALLDFISTKKFIAFIENFIGGASIAFLSYLTGKVGLAHNIDVIIIGVMMPLLPGYALTNAIRDAISGDHVSSLSRGMSAMISGIALALGVGMVLRFI